jgi:hypothetical protein
VLSHQSLLEYDQYPEIIFDENYAILNENTLLSVEEPLDQPSQVML